MNEFHEGYHDHTWQTSELTTAQYIIKFNYSAELTVPKKHYYILKIV